MFIIQEEQLGSAPLAELLEEWRKLGHLMLPVPPLPRPQVAEFIAVVAGRDQVGESEAEWLFRLTGGNPFFLQESVGWFDQQRRARLDRPAGWAAGGPVSQLEAVLAQRLAAVDEDTRTFLDAASVVLETTQDLEPVAYAMDADEGRAVALFTRASRLRLMVEDPGGRISFRHDLTRQAVYRQLGVRHRGYLHSRAGRWHQQQGWFASAAYHFDRAGRTEEMVRAALQAAEQAEQAGMYYSALLHYQKALPYRDFAEIGPSLGKANLVLGRWQEAEQILAGLSADDARVRLLRSELRFVTGDFTAAAREAEQALQLDRGLAVEALIRLADVHLYLGEFDLARQYARRATEAADQGGSASDRIRCVGILGATLLFGGAVDDGERAFQQALDLLVSRPDQERCEDRQRAGRSDRLRTHRWLIDPRSGEIVFWTAETGIDGRTSVELDELHLMCVDPSPAYIWYRDMADFAEGISDAPAAGCPGPSRAEARFAEGAVDPGSAGRGKQDRRLQRRSRSPFSSFPSRSGSWG